MIIGASSMPKRAYHDPLVFDSLRLEGSIILPPCSMPPMQCTQRCQKAAELLKQYGVQTQHVRTLVDQVIHQQGNGSDPLLGPNHG